jgi:hypothetical protein
MREHANLDKKPEREQPELQSKEEEAETSTKFAGGKAPPVAGGFGEQNGTAQLAFEEDENVKELKQKVAKLVNERFNGDYKAAFEHYNADKGSGVSKSEITRLLADAGVGNGFTRKTWASRIVEKLDVTGDQEVQWREFEVIIKQSA